MIFYFGKRWQFLALLGLFALGLTQCAAPRKISPPASMPVPAMAITSLESLAASIDSLITGPRFHTTNVGVRVVRIRDGKVLYDHNGGKLFHPASNMKLFTTAAALKYLGPNFRFVTRVAADIETAVTDTLKGDLYLIGAGDPDFSYGDLAYLVEQLHARGIRYIDGNIICDDTALDTLWYGNGWMWDEGDSRDFAPIGALTLHDNSVEVHVASGDSAGQPLKVWLVPETSYLNIINSSQTISLQMLRSESDFDYRPVEIERNWQARENSIRIEGMLPNDGTEVTEWINVVNPSLYFGQVFREQCEEKGIGVAGTVRRGAAPDTFRVLARQVSEPLLNLVINTNKPSDNLSAELLLKTVGAKVFGAPGTASKGIQAIKTMLSGWGLDTTRCRFTDGSGVSRYNLVSPDILVGLLVNIYRDFSLRSEFIASLPIAGVDGTLRTRMKQTAAFRVVHAKTGTLSGVTTLSGYTQSLDGEVLAFSIMMSHFLDSAWVYRSIQDEICDRLTRLYLPSQ